jgi:hypothetical protein
VLRAVVDVELGLRVVGRCDQALLHRVRDLVSDHVPAGSARRIERARREVQLVPVGDCRAAEVAGNMILHDLDGAEVRREALLELRSELRRQRATHARSRRQLR